LIGTEHDAMPHAVFNYPNNNTQNQFIEALGNGLVITTEYKVSKIERSGADWLINGEKRVDILISTMPLNIIPFVLADAPDEIKSAARLLRYNKISNMLWETDEIGSTWTYCPDPSTIFHRHIHIGNFLAPKSNITITEVIGDISPEVMENEGAKFEYLKKPIDYHISDHAYVVFDSHYFDSVRKLKDYLKSINIHTLGRFGEWEYYNMDICIESAMRIAKKLTNKDQL
jgi:protoporphyrinogen oxidase